jgi:hypothetical protein
MHKRGEPCSKNFGKQLSKAVDQADWSIVINLGGLTLLEKHNISLINKVEATRIKRPERVESTHNISLDDVPGGSVK